METLMILSCIPVAFSVLFGLLAAYVAWKHQKPRLAVEGSELQGFPFIDPSSKHPYSQLDKQRRAS